METWLHSTERWTKDEKMVAGLRILNTFESSLARSLFRVSSNRVQILAVCFVFSREMVVFWGRQATVWIFYPHWGKELKHFLYMIFLFAFKKHCLSGLLCNICTVHAWKVSRTTTLGTGSFLQDEHRSGRSGFGNVFPPATKCLFRHFSCSKCFKLL